MTASTTIPQARLARLLHASLLATPLLFFGIAVFLGSLPSAPVSDAPGMLRWAGLGVGSVLVAVAAILRNTVPRRLADEPEDPWWKSNLPRAIMLWALAETVGVAGATLSLVAGDPLGALPLVAASTILLLHLSPARLSAA